MGLFDKVSGFVKREGEDIGAAADRARDRLDKELAEREAELEMTPSEKLRALQRKARANATRVDEIMEKAGVPEPPVEPEAPAAEQTQSEPPQVTQIVLPDGSVRRGDEAVTDIEPELDEAETGPPEGDLAWVAPRDGEEAIVPAFSASVAAAAPSSPSPTKAPEPQQDDRPAAGSDAVVAPAETAPDHAPQLESPGEPEPEVALEARPPEPPPAPEPAADAEPPPPPPPPPPPRREPEPEAPARPAAQEPPRRETPAEIAARVVAELEQAVNEEPEPLRDPIPPPPQPEPTFEKTPAQRKYEEARKAADALLEELRGELKDDGEI